MKKLSDQFEDASKQLVWLDTWAYCRKLFLDGEQVAWNDGASFDGFIRKSDALLSPGVTSLSFLEFLNWLAVAMPNLKLSMSEKSRIGYPLKTLLRNEEVRRVFVQAIGIAGNASPNKPLVLEMPSPRFLVNWAYQLAHGKAAVGVGIDQADSAGVYLSDFVSSLGHSDISAVLVEETQWNSQEWLEESEIYTPLRNVTDHQQWELGVKIPFEIENETTLKSFDFVICPDAKNLKVSKAGQWIDEKYWALDAPDVNGDFFYSKIPSEAVPEKVLDNRKLLGGF